MTFDKFKNLYTNIQNMPLPGENSQLKMAPAARLVEEKILSKQANNARKAGVMVLFYGENDLHVALIRRTYDGSVHSGQISFPGGELESVDKNLLDTAKRELYEEIGVREEKYEVIKELTDIYIPPSNFYVQPYLAICHTPPIFYKQDLEVAEVLQVPIKQVLDDNNLINTELKSAYNTIIEVPAFKFDGHIVWGATAMILHEVRDLIKHVNQQIA
ncbi:MAG TPA: CoA pyrophosphatase [Flavobacteriaceae bacterium]|nr:CoA pyrophosphatase [Flavobacteriaceae bacterium]